MNEYLLQEKSRLLKEYNCTSLDEVNDKLDKILEEKENDLQ